MITDLKGKTALVTGGSRGIGRAMAIRLGELGAHVCINYLRKKSCAEEVVREIEDKGGTASIYKVNVSDPVKCEEMMNDIKQQFQILDILIANAAIGVLKPFEELKPRHWQTTMDTNAGSLMNLSRLMVRMNGDKGGRIIAISSLGSVRSLKHYTIIGASKAAIESIVRHLAVELGPRGYRVNVLSPGLVKTNALKYFPDMEEMIDVVNAKTPLGRLVTPDDVANVMTFLCSSYSDMINGEIITVDGGYSLIG